MVGGSELHGNLGVALPSRLQPGGAWPWGRRGCRSGGSELSPPLCRVEVLGCRPWPLGRFGRRLVWCVASGPACGVVLLYRFSVSFPYKVANSLLLYRLNGKPVAWFQKKKNIFGAI